MPISSLEEQRKVLAEKLELPENASFHTIYTQLQSLDLQQALYLIDQANNYCYNNKPFDDRLNDCNRNFNHGQLNPGHGLNQQDAKAAQEIYKFLVNAHYKRLNGDANHRWQEIEIKKPEVAHISPGDPARTVAGARRANDPTPTIAQPRSTQTLTRATSHRQAKRASSQDTQQPQDTQQLAANVAELDKQWAAKKERARQLQQQQANQQQPAQQPSIQPATAQVDTNITPTPSAAGIPQLPRINVEDAIERALHKLDSDWEMERSSAPGRPPVIEVREANNPNNKFTIEPNRIHLPNTSIDSYIAALECFKELHKNDGALPNIVISKYSPQAMQNWKDALEQVYPGQNISVKIKGTPAPALQTAAAPGAPTATTAAPDSNPSPHSRKR